MKQVALIVETATAFGRAVLTGVSQYIHEHEYWACFLTPGTATEFPRGLDEWSGDGVIASVYSHDVAEQIRAMGLPTVNVANGLADSGFPQVITDSVAIGRMAAEHLIEHGFTRLAYLGFPNLQYAVERRRGFTAAASEADVQSQWFWPEGSVEGVTWSAHRRYVAEWLKTLELPVGIMACHDVQGRTLVEVCNSVGLRVPEDVAVVAADDDHVLCDLSNPPMSSVDVAADVVGYRAAELLARMMKGRAIPNGPIHVPPRFLVARKSSDILAVEDEEVATALAYIRRNERRPINVENILEVVPMSRRSLERRFVKAIGRLPAAEIRRVHVNRAKRLLTITELDLAAIAQSSGFASAKSLQDVFSRDTGMTPSEYRRRFRRRN